MREKIRNLLHDLLTDISRQEHTDQFIDKWEAEIISLLPNLDNFEVVEECEKCEEGCIRLEKNGKIYWDECPQCIDGKVTREATWGECIEGLNNILNKDHGELEPYNDNFDLGVRLFSGGILRLKGE